MNLKAFFRSDDRAVSPVLGVALLIAITVILAGVVAFVVLGVDQNNAEAPSASLDFQQESGEVFLEHTGGAVLNYENLEVRIVDADTTAAIAPATLSANIATGDQVLLATNVETGDRFSIVWNDPNSDREVLLAQYVAE